MPREYGGYLPLELPKGNEFYEGDHVISLNSGRYAILYALMDGHWDCIYLPYFLCHTVEDAIHRFLPQIDIRYYHIDTHFLPANVTLKENECILWVNYFGIQPEEVIDEIVEKYKKHLILDFTQSFFTPPREEVYQVYSCRKFFGVCDGSYIIHNGIHKLPLKKHYSSTYAFHLVQSFEHGTNYSYSLNKENELRLNNCGIGTMSPLTTAILRAADYSFVQNRRLSNMKALHSILAPYNQLPVFHLTPAMNYPFLCLDSSLRDELTLQKIYIPQFWKETAANVFSSPWEIFLSEHLCALPVDQRYNVEDMYAIGKIILNLLKKKKVPHETKFCYSLL